VTEVYYQRLQLVTDHQEKLATDGDFVNILHRKGANRAAQETFWAIAYGPMLDVAAVFEVNRGDYLAVSLHLPALLAGVLISGTDRFVIAHNHPSNDPEPSKTDISLTREVMKAANDCGLYFEDHFILTPSGKYISLKSEGILVPAKTPYDIAAAASRSRSRQ
jgi:DNA repair protein RadC